MANNGPILNQSYHHNNQYHCKECGVYFDSAKSLEVHVQYHKENLLSKWASQAASQQNNLGDETNNNVKAKREFYNSNSTIVAAAADSSDSSIKKSPDRFRSSTPESTQIATIQTTPASGNTSFGHPPTPQSYNSAPSPYQNAEINNFSPNFHFSIKNERASPSYQNFIPQHNPQHYENPQYYEQQNYDLHNKQHSISNNYRYHPYSQVVTSSSRSPSYASQNPQPTPSPSPKQCDKCGFFCETPGQLLEHVQIAHQFDPRYYNEIKIKNENEPQAEILDLDSQKVHVYQTPEEQDAIKRQQELALSQANSNHNPHSVTSMLSNWSPQTKMYNNEQLYQNRPENDPKMYPPIKEEKEYVNTDFINNIKEEKSNFNNGDFLSNNVSTTTQEIPGINPNLNQTQIPHPYRPFENMPNLSTSTPQISSTQTNITKNSQNNELSQQLPKGTTWKSNEARRPKTYNCTACNKWFTSSGHLKRHYNTTLHKNAVKSSGQPDPATLPVSAHHHPARDPNYQGPRQSKHHKNQNILSSSMQQKMNEKDSSSADDSHDMMSPAFERSPTFDRNSLLLQPPNGPYDRNSSNCNSNSSNLHGSSNSLTNLSEESPPNGDAGPSDPSRGLPMISTMNTNIATPQPNHPYSPFNILNQQQHMMDMNPQIYHPMAAPALPTHVSNYPNELSPHATQTMVAINSNQLPQQALISQIIIGENKPLPSFSQFQKFIIADFSGVGGPSSVTDSKLPSYNKTFTIKNYNQEYILPDNDLNNEEETFIITENNFGQSTDGAIVTYEHVDQNVMQDDNNVSLYSPINETENDLGIDLSEQVTIIKEEEVSQDELETLQEDLSEEMLNKYVTQDMIDQSNEQFANFIYVQHNEEEMNPHITSTGSPIAPKKRQNTSNGVHKCIDCDKVFNRVCYLTQHNKTFHSGYKPFKCNRCGKRYFNKDTYQQHTKKHAGDKPHKCDQCPKQFNHKTDLRRHMCLHTGQKPYTCETCGKGFIRKDHMVKHGAIHTRKQKSNFQFYSNSTTQVFEAVQDYTMNKQTIEASKDLLIP